MQIVLRGDAAGYEAEHVARLFFPGAELAGADCRLDDPDADVVAAVDHTLARLVYLRRGGRLWWGGGTGFPPGPPVCTSGSRHVPVSGRPGA